MDHERLMPLSSVPAISDLSNEPTVTFGLPDHPMDMPDHDLSPLPLAASAPAQWLRGLIGAVTGAYGARRMQLDIVPVDRPHGPAES